MSIRKLVTAIALLALAAVAAPAFAAERPQGLTTLDGFGKLVTDGNGNSVQRDPDELD